MTCVDFSKNHRLAQSKNEQFLQKSAFLGLFLGSFLNYQLRLQTAKNAVGYQLLKTKSLKNPFLHEVKFPPASVVLFFRPLKTYLLSV